MRTHDRNARPTTGPARPTETVAPESTTPGDPPDAPSGDPRGTIAVHHGIHIARYPIAGMTVAAARRVLAPLMNIDPEAIAVIRGEIVEDEEGTTLSGDEETLGFVKRSSVKGAA